MHLLPQLFIIFSPFCRKRTWIPSENSSFLSRYLLLKYILLNVAQHAHNYKCVLSGVRSTHIPFIVMENFPKCPQIWRFFIIVLALRTLHEEIVSSYQNCCSRRTNGNSWNELQSKSLHFPHPCIYRQLAIDCFELQ